VHFTGPARPPEKSELDYKKTVWMNPMECTIVIAKFDLPTTPFAVPPNPRTGGLEYVWHCHILEHVQVSCKCKCRFSLLTLIRRRPSRVPHSGGQ
jgi:FtsP/CotA-like multicopper oxidase with cupredoxin domain